MTAGSDGERRTARRHPRDRVAQRKPRPADDERVELVAPREAAMRTSREDAYTRHAGAALRRPRQPPGARGGARRRATAASTAASSAATTRCSAAGRRRPSSACSTLPGAIWIRGNGERWTADPDDAPDDPSCRARSRPRREALGARLVAELAALPENAPPRRHAIWHGSPVSDMRSFLPEPADDEAELLEGVDRARGWSSATRTCPFRRIDRGGIELVNPGSVGMPFDGDPRAAYALLHDDGTIEHRRVAYDHGPAPRSRPRASAPSGARSSRNGSSRPARTSRWPPRSDGARSPRRRSSSVRCWGSRATGRKSVGLVLAFGAGALISAVSFDLAEEGIELGGGDRRPRPRAGRADLLHGRPASSGSPRAARNHRARGGDAGTALALGAFLDGIPEQLVLGIGIADGRGRQRRAARRDLRLQPARGDRVLHRDAAPAAARARSCGCGSPSRSCARSRRWPDGRSPTRVGRPAGGDRRVRRRRAARDAHRLDDPRGRARAGTPRAW